jgi:6-phosphofructokinase 1
MKTPKKPHKKRYRRSPQPLYDSFSIEKLGLANITSPIKFGTSPGDLLVDFTPDDYRVVASLALEEILEYTKKKKAIPSLEKAGARQHIYFDPPKLKVGIVTCGGLCPGLNDVIRGLVMTLRFGYGVAGIYGFKYGFEGLIPAYSHPAIELSPEIVRDIHNSGGTLLGTSRGLQDTSIMVDTLERMNIRLLFAIGGDGTFRGALAIHEEIKKRGLKIGVIGVPKTIDDDIPLVDRTFGFQTAVELAVQALKAAYSEALSAKNGVGLVKLMGRNSGFIASHAALAMRNVNLVLIPEVPFDIEGPSGLFSYLERRFQIKKSTVIVVAEGAGQEHIPRQEEKDDRVKKKLPDIGLFLRDKIIERLSVDYDFTLKYIDPSYMIRSHPANANDSIFCGHLAQTAAHAGMSGRTGMAVGRSHGKFTHIPLERLVETTKTIDPEGDLWSSVLESTGQPFSMLNN